jgi:hypothetical protein
MSKFLPLAVTYFESCDVQRDGGPGAVAAGEEPLALDRASRDDAAQPSCHVAEGHRMQFAFDLALSVRLGLHRLVLQCAIDRRNASRGVAQITALCEGGDEREAVVAGAGAD